MVTDQAWLMARPSVALSRVTRGVAWLKEFGPSYNLHYARIDPHTVSVSDPQHCPLAQAHPSGRYTGALLHIADLRLAAPLNDWIAENGFDVYFTDSADMYAHLTVAWRQLLGNPT